MKGRNPLRDEFLAALATLRKRPHVAAPAAIDGFGSRLKEWRTLRRMTQDDLANAADSHFTTISKLEAGERLPTLELAIRLAKALGVTVNDLVPGMAARDRPKPA